MGIKLISNRTGYSPATVSNALNHKKGVSQKASDEIIHVAREIGYIGNLVISKIKLVIYKKNGLIVDNTPYFEILISGIEQECRKYGCELVIGNLDSRHIDYQDKAKQMINEPGTAIILLGTELSSEDLMLYKNSLCPLLLLDYWSFDMEFNGVMINNADSVRKAVNHLVSNGHEVIGYLKGKLRIQSFEQRQSGYHSALRENSLPIKSEYVIELSTTMNDAYKDMLLYLKGKPALPTAFIADNDMIALGAMKALLENNYRIPEDISIIGFDDLPFCEISSPRLTSLRIPKREMGQLAVRKLIDMVKRKDEVRVEFQISTEFIERDSVRRRIHYEAG